MEVETKKSKRGRKPKGGKLIPCDETLPFSTSTHVVSNVILHLKCRTSDIISKDSSEIHAYSQNENQCYSVEYPNNSNYQPSYGTDDAPCDSMTQKISKIKCNHANYTYQNDISPCFWCTYAFDTPIIYIPMYIDSQGVYYVYGHFCSPECAVGFLMQERLETTAKFERYALIHSMYIPAFSYNQCIKPAPAPYYVLNRYYGNMTIEEYRKLYHNDKFMLVLKKPIRKIISEIHDDNSDFIMKSRTIPFHDTVSSEKTTNNLTQFVKTHIRK